jgi:ribosomal protein S18 acetylase RimI-like enzyme
MRITRRLNPGEGPLYRAVRLEALRESPEAFSSRHEDAVARSEQSWADQADSSATGSDRATFVTFEVQPVGLAALYRDEHAPDVGELIQMWVAPGVRGRSVATGLLLEIFRWAGSNRFAFVKAEVMKGNARALRFYEKFGFALSSDHHTAFSVLLVKPVEPAGTGPPAAAPVVKPEGGDQAPPEGEGLSG